MKSLKGLALLTFLFLSHTATATDLINKIDQAQKRLSTTENRIASERQVLAKQLFSLEQELVALREKAALAQRMSDEKTLSLSKLEARLKSWKQQQGYQQNLLQRFLQQNGATVASSTGQDKSEALSRIHAAINVAESLQGGFQPQWQPADVVLESGDIKSLPTLSVGPVTWYWNPEAEHAGFASRQGDAEKILRSELILSAGHSRDINQLRENLKGHIVFDPTLTRAMAREQHAESIVQHLVKGGVWAVPIILFAVFALAIALVKAQQLFRLKKCLRFTPAVLQGVLREPHSPITTKVEGMQKTLLTIAQQASSPQSRDDQLFMQLQDDKHWLERWLGGIAITAAIAPLLGLLGTVSGMIETFKMMTLFGSGDPEVVSGGIAQALITTELGLVVAIPALILNAVLSRRAKAYYNELESFAILISKSDDESTKTNSDHSEANEGEAPKVKNAARNRKSHSASAEEAIA